MGRANRVLSWAVVLVASSSCPSLADVTNPSNFAEVVVNLQNEGIEGTPTGNRNLYQPGLLYNDLGFPTADSLDFAQSFAGSGSGQTYAASGQSDLSVSTQDLGTSWILDASVSSRSTYSQIGPQIPYGNGITDGFTEQPLGQTGMAAVSAQFNAFSPMRYTLTITGSSGLGIANGVNFLAGSLGGQITGRVIPTSNNFTIPAGSYSGVLPVGPHGASYILTAAANSTADLSSGAIAASDASSASVHFVATPLPPLHVLSFGVDWLLSKGLLNNGIDGWGSAEVAYQTFAGLPTFVPSPAPIDLDPTAPAGTNTGKVLLGFSELESGQYAVHPNDTVVIFFASHGAFVNGKSVLLLSDGGDTFNSDDLASYLKDLPSSAHKIVFIEGCQSGGFLTSAAGLQNTAILTATDTVGSDGSDPRTGYGLFTSALTSLIYSGTYDLDQLQQMLTKFAWGDLLGQQLQLYDAGGAGTFQGLSPQLYETPDFVGDILGPPIAVPEPKAMAVVLASICAALVRTRVVAPKNR